MATPYTMPQPLEIRRVNPLELSVLWADDHRSTFSSEYLRKVCPCESCHDERRQAETGLRVISKEIPARVEMNQISGVGRYAIQIEFSDGHNTGIYSFELLRKLCPCEQCREAWNREE